MDEIQKQYVWNKYSDKIDGTIRYYNVTFYYNQSGQIKRIT